MATTQFTFLHGAQTIDLDCHVVVSWLRRLPSVRASIDGVE